MGTSSLIEPINNSIAAEGCKVRAISIILFGKPFTFEEELEHIDVKRLHEFRKNLKAIVEI
jgi:hypothetical protein